MILAAGAEVGFVGTGVMGASMAGHLMDAGFRLAVHNRTRAKAESLIARGARWAETAGDAARDADAVVTIVGYPKDVEHLYLGSGGIVESAKEGAYLVDMTTSSPALATRIAGAASARGLHALDAPVSGGDVGAREARLTIMVGGDEDAFHAAEPMLRVMGANVVLQGGAGAGQHTKMCNQIAIASTMVGVVEALTYAKAAGLDPKLVLESISAGAAGSWTLSNLAPRMLAGDTAPGFFVKHFIKDMWIAISSADEMGLELPGLRLAKHLYDQLAEAGYGDAGTQSLIELYGGVDA
ncbi:MAG: NAD(P)-dependent oxidoreductase [Actinomycetota bacterium]|nr:NAD(P)-dependent oxidoreductase [Actinomycetota bacterium]